MTRRVIRAADLFCGAGGTSQGMILAANRINADLIRFRMLTARELARAQGFEDDYAFTGNREEIVKQIGNAVPPPVAAALFGAVMQRRC